MSAFVAIWIFTLLFALLGSGGGLLSSRAWEKGHTVLAIIGFLQMMLSFFIMFNLWRVSI